MSPAQWKSLLTNWSTQLINTDLASHLDPVDRNLPYLGFPPASPDAISSLEFRLGVSLPPSYRAFLQTTDGFRVISPFIYRLRSIADVDWFRVEHQGWIETWNEPTPYSDPDRPDDPDEEYYDYSRGPENGMRASHLGTMLQISDHGDGVMLLNPLAVTPDGEWEAWFLANWIPGAYRYASFAHMMLETYRSMRELQKLPQKPGLPEIKLPDPKLPRHHVIDVPKPSKPKRRPPKRKKAQSQIEHIANFLTAMDQEECAPAPPELTQLLHDLSTPDPKALKKTLRILQGKLKIRAMSPRHPDLIPLASDIAHSHPSPEVRSTCVSLLTTITPDGPVPQWLITAVNDPDPSVQISALYAVYHFKGPELFDPIVRILAGAQDIQSAEAAARALAELPDARAVLPLIAALHRNYPYYPHAPINAQEQFFRQTYLRIALTLARYGQHAVPHLLPLLQHADPGRREATVVALRAIGDPTSRPAVAKLQSDPDPNVRQQAELCDKIWGDSFALQPHDDLTNTA